MINDRTLSMASKKAGKASTVGRIVVSPDGKSRTLTLTQNVGGKKISGIGVYDKQ